MESKKQKIGIIDVGGGMRDVYAAGILDTCLELGIEFDYCIGISAGSGNVITYLADRRDEITGFTVIISSERNTSASAIS